MQWWNKIGPLALALAALPVWADLPADLVAERASWAHIRYELPKDQRGDALERLTRSARRVSEAHPDQAAPLVWEAIITATLAGERGPFGGALGYAEEALRLLQEAETLPPDEMQSSLYATMGSLYYRVPGWPIGFGDDDKARAYLQKALALNPDGIDANYFYGDFLLDQGDYQEALSVLRHALAAPPRRARPLADAGRRKEIEAALAKARAEFGEG